MRQKKDRQADTQTNRQTDKKARKLEGRRADLGDRQIQLNESRQTIQNMLHLKSNPG